MSHPPPTNRTAPVSIIDVGIVLLTFMAVGFICGYYIGKTE